MLEIFIHVAILCRSVLSNGGCGFGGFYGKSQDQVPLWLSKKHHLGGLIPFQA